MSQRLIQNSVSRSWNIKPLSNWRPFVSLYLVQWGFWYMWFQYATITEIYRKRRKEFSPYLHHAEWIKCAWAAQKYISLGKIPFPLNHLQRFNQICCFFFVMKYIRRHHSIIIIEMANLAQDTAINATRKQIFILWIAIFIVHSNYRLQKTKKKRKKRINLYASKLMVFFLWSTNVLHIKIIPILSI